MQKSSTGNTIQSRLKKTLSPTNFKPNSSLKRVVSEKHFEIAYQRQIKESSDFFKLYKKLKGDRSKLLETFSNSPVFNNEKRYHKLITSLKIEEPKPQKSKFQKLKPLSPSIIRKKA